MTAEVYDFQVGAGDTDEEFLGSAPATPRDANDVVGMPPTPGQPHDTPPWETGEGLTYYPQPENRREGTLTLTQAHEW